ncbi:hypothetical protein GE061_012489 [Apolygus lucorum]|uniref:Uncharacterized protein n=1 Tax=Apolygus lucorum TaxID=248454 RepID=A0A8S9XSE8_APOLU|nr:hypothetical protein GE061_012489 [Apolygus lucorum]
MITMPCLRGSLASSDACFSNRARDAVGILHRSLDFAQSSHVQDAFVIAVEAQARERLERLSALKRIKPVDITKLCHQLSKENPEPELNGFLENSPIYVTSYPPPTGAGPVPCTTPPSKPSSAPGSVKKSPLSNGHAQSQVEDQPEEIELKQELKSSEDSTSTVTPSKEEKLASEFGGPGRRASSPFSNGRTEVLIGQDVPQSAGEKVKTTALVENKSVTATPPDCVTRCGDTNLKLRAEALLLFEERREVTLVQPGLEGAHTGSFCLQTVTMKIHLLGWKIPVTIQRPIGVGFWLHS